MRARLVPIEDLDIGEIRQRMDGTSADLAAALAFVRALPDPDEIAPGTIRFLYDDAASSASNRIPDPLAAALGSLGLQPTA